MRDGLKTAVEELSRTYPEPRFGWGSPDAQFASLAENSSLDQWLAAVSELAADLDQKTTAAYLLSILTWQLGQVLGALYLSGIPLPQLRPEYVGVAYILSGSEGERALDFAFRVSVDRELSPRDRDRMSASIVALHSPMVEGLHSRTGLARKAMWRLIVDGMSAGFLGFGKKAGLEELAMAEAEAILRRPDLPLHNTHWRFATVEGGGISEAFRLRGGCCRLYRSPGHEFCTTCVLRDESDQIGRLEALLRRRAAQ